jgi:hypothetical protein
VPTTDRFAGDFSPDAPAGAPRMTSPPGLGPWQNLKMFSAGDFANPQAGFTFFACQQVAQLGAAPGFRCLQRPGCQALLGVDTPGGKSGLCGGNGSSVWAASPWAYSPTTSDVGGLMLQLTRALPATRR